MYTSFQKYLFKLLCAVEKAYVLGCMIYDVRISQPWNLLTSQVYEGYITRVECLDLLAPQKQTIWCISIWEKVAGLVLYHYFPYWFQVYANARLLSVFKEDLKHAPGKTYRVFVHGYPHAFLCKHATGFEVPYDLETAKQVHKQASKKYILVLIDGHHDITTCFKKHCDSFTEDLGLTTTEIIGLACLDAGNVQRYLDYLVRSETNVVFIDDDTFEEKVFKKTQKVVI